MNDIKIFENKEFGRIRTAGTADNPLFCLADVCKAIDLKNPSSVKSRLDKEDMQLIDLHALKYNEGSGYGNTVATFITEAGFYDVVLHSNSKKVKPFRKWVTSTVLPSIRKTGQYGVFEIPKTYAEALRLAADQQDMIEHQRQVIEENETEIIALTEKVNEMNSKAVYYDQILKSKNTILPSQIAKDYGLSAIRLNRILKNLHIQHKMRGQWLLYSKHTGKGYTKSVSIPFKYNDGTNGTKMQTEWTQKGRLFLYEELKKNGILPTIEK
jgi:prophage antirepressor-like protein